MRRLLLLIIILNVAFGCVRLPAPSFEPPKSFLYAINSDADSLGYDMRWWYVFKDTTLNELQNRALNGNFDLAVAASRVETARIKLKVARAKYTPQLGLSGEASIARSSDNGRLNSYSLSSEVSWEAPLFGALRYTKMASRADIYSAEWAFRGVILSLTAEVANTYYSLLRYLELLRVARLTLESRRASAALTDSLSRRGMASAIDREQAYSLLYSAEADCTSYSGMIKESVISLQILFGETPSPMRVDGWVGRLRVDSLPESLSVGLPSQLLERRPDVMQAKFQADAAAAHVGLANAARFPAINITANGGILSHTIEGLTSGNPLNWSLVGALTQPIFTFGRLKGEERIARENYYQSLFLYEKSFVEAVAEVEESLLEIESTKQEIFSVERLLKSNEQVAELTNQLFLNGMSAYLDVLDAERSRYETNQRLVELWVSQYLNYIALFKALGGGW